MINDLAKTVAGLSAIFVPLALLWGCGTGAEPVVLSETEPVAGHPEDLPVERSRWVGIGSYDACGLSWALDLHQDGDRVTGRLLWETVRYDLKGTLSEDGTLENARAGKNPDFNGTPAPRFVRVSLNFGATRAIGSYAAETKGSNDCATAVELKRYSAEEPPAPGASSSRDRPPAPPATDL